MEAKLSSEVLQSFDFDALEFSEMEELIYRAIGELPE